ncbi:unnamed protein product [Rhizoctonia solani]|uniref:Uncharacterized protein n=1 Tax=Rhizoctonia solani TaxID=456999 RepID=A0A8H2X505_9AGAM|nr:unnamed protein product [Rhizoctonia solani]
MAPTTVPASGKAGGQKVSLACDFCRARKRKCDGVRPVCGHCRLTKNTCTFNVHADKRKPPSKTYVSALEARVRTLEALLQASSLEIPPSDVEIQRTAENEPELVRPNVSDPRPVKALDPRAEIERLPEESGATAAALADIGKLRLEVEKTEGDTNNGEATNFTYFGATSSRFLSSIGDIQAGDPTDALPRDQGYVKCFEDSDDEMTFKTYWEWQRIHFPIVDPDTFYADYNAGKRNSEFVSPMLLDIIYAVGENFGPTRSIERSLVYLKRAEAAIMTEIGTPRISTIQAIVMMSMFQMGNGKIPVAWILNGMSVALSTRLGLHIDSSGLVIQRIMSQITHQARKDAFWAVFVIDRLHSTIMGVHPLHSRRSISTHRPSEPNRNPFIPPNIELAGVAPTPPTAPKTQELPAVCWNTLRDLVDIVDYMLGDIYSFDAPKRTVSEDYDLVTRNMLTIQAYIDDMPSPLRVTAALRGNEPCLAFLHVYVNLFILLLNRPFVGPRPPSNANEAEQQLERRCRSLAFAHCRKAALRIMELIRHLPRASPCFTTPYFIFSASTVLLLSPNDTQALRGVQVGLKCLEDLEADRYWVDAVVDARARILALAQRWGANQLFENLGAPSSVVTPSVSTPDPTTRDPTPPGPAPEHDPYIAEPAPMVITDTSRHYNPPASWGDATLSSADPTLFAQRLAEMDMMYLESLPEAADMIPWAGAVEPSWGTMGTHHSPEYTMPGWEFTMSTGASAGQGFMPYQHPPPSKSYVLALEARIKTLESRGQVLEQLLREASINVPSPESDGIDLSTFLEASQRSSAEPDEPDEGLPEDSGASVAALLDIGKLRLEVASTQSEATSNGTPATFTYFGPQSSRFLSGTDSPSTDSAKTRDYGTPHTSTWFPFCSPEEERALLSTFWAWQRIHFPIVLPDPFLTAYNAQHYNCELVTPMLLDMIFAIGSYFGPGKEGGDGAQGERFFMRAESRVIEEINNPRVATVQALLIMAIFQMGHAKTPVAWTLNGMAVALSTRLGLHIDTSSLVASGTMPKDVHASRDTTFWAVFTLDRIFSTNMGLHPLHSRRSISTPKPRQRIAESKSSAFENAEIPDAVWVMLCEFMDMVESMFAEVYAFDAPKRTAVQDCDLITKNMLTIQAFVDDFPRPLRSASAMRGTEPCLVFLHVRICLYIILVCRPFVGPRRYSPPAGSTLPLSAADVAAERRCRTLAFGHCRTAALRTMDLLRHLPPRSPCFTTPFFIFTASTVLLLSPRDSQAMRAVRTGLTCLEGMERDGMWVESVVDAKQRIWGLARRWEVGGLSDGGWHHITPRPQSQATSQPARSQSGATSHSNAASHSHSNTALSPLSATSPTQDKDRKPHARADSEPHGSPQSPFDYTTTLITNSNSPSNFDQYYLDSMPEQNVAIPWAAGPVEPALWLMGTNNGGSSFQSSWDYLLSNPSVAQSDTHRVLSPQEAEALMADLRRGALGPIDVLYTIKSGLNKTCAATSGDCDKQRSRVHRAVFFCNLIHSVELISAVIGHLLHALESRRHKLSVSDADLDQLLSEVKDARDVKGPEQFTDSLEKVLQDLKSLPEAHAFLKPVTRADAPDYHLGEYYGSTMSKKVRTKQYRNKAEFIADLNLIWDNCLTYNAHPTHPLRRCANTLRKRTSILSEIIQDPADRSAPLTLRKIPSLRRRSLVDDSDDDYHSSSGGRPMNKLRLNGNLNGVDKAVNGNGVNGRVSSTPESDVPMRPTLPRSGKSRRPLPEESFSDRTAISRTPESMSQFISLDKELARLELQTAGAGPSRIKEDFMHEELNRRLRNQLRQIRANDEDIQRLDEWRDVDESKAGGGGKRKRLVIASSDEEEEDATARRTKFSTTGLPPDQEEYETHHDLWWEAMRSSGMIGNGILQMAQHGFPDVKPGIMRRRKKRPKDTGLKGIIHKNIGTLHNIRRVHTKILVLNALAEENQDNNDDIPIPPDSPTTEVPIVSIPGLTLAEDSGAACLNRVSTTVLQHAGFEGSSQAALDVLQHVVSDYLENVGRSFRFMVDTFGKTMSNEQIVLHALAEHGISEVQELERYIKDDVERYGTRLQDLERKLTHAYDEQTQAGAMEDDELFDEENENLVMGGFAGELGEDFFGLRELGLDQEFGLTSLSIPRKLLRTRRNNAANANATKEPQLPYPPPPPFHPIHTASLESHIGLLHPFYASKAPAPQVPHGTQGAHEPSTGVVLPDDPVNNLKVKMGPLGQIISVTPNAGKKKGGGGGGGNGGGAGGDGAKHEGAGTGGAPSKSQKKKEKDKKPPVHASNDPPLTMPKFGIGAAKSPVVPPSSMPPPEVSTMMPDFSQFVSGVHAGV